MLTLESTSQRNAVDNLLMLSWKLLHLQILYVNTFCHSRVWKLFESLLNFRIMLESKIATRKLSENRFAKDIHCCMYSVKINSQPQRQNCRNRKWSLLPLTESRVIINVSMTDVVFLGFRFIFPVCKLHSIRCIDVKLIHWIIGQVSS